MLLMRSAAAGDRRSKKHTSTNTLAGREAFRARMAAWSFRCVQGEAERVFQEPVIGRQRHDAPARRSRAFARSSNPRYMLPGKKGSEGHRYEGREQPSKGKEVLSAR